MEVRKDTNYSSNFSKICCQNDHSIGIHDISCLYVLQLQGKIPEHV